MKKQTYNWLPDFVYGSIDGVVTTFAVVSGVKGASLSTAIILILGFANLFGDGFSMAVGKYLSDKAHLDHVDGASKEGIMPLRGALYTFFSFNLMGLIPLLGYILAPMFHYNEEQTFIITSASTLFALYLIGVIKGKVVQTSKTIAGLQTMAVGGVAAIIAYGVGFYVDRLVS